jgi:nucleotidyltransferase/DNA polymerase involved in DNA repair
MRIAFVSIPRFSCAAEVQRAPGLALRPLIVGDSEQPKRVADCSYEADERGVRVGMTLRKALGLCPDAAVLPPDPVYYRCLWEAAIGELHNLSPEVEDGGPGGAYLNVGGLARHYRDEDHLAGCILDAIRLAGCPAAGAGFADGKFTAFIAATLAQPGTARLVMAGEEAAYLAPLRVDFLPFDSKTLSRLHLLGLDYIGDIAALSFTELQSQFGFDARRLWQLANGIDEEPLRAKRPLEALQTGVSLEAPAAGIDVIVAVARQLLSRLRLPLKGRAARELTLQAELVTGRGWEHRLVFREAVSEDERLAFLLRSALTNFPPPQAVQSLSLRLSGLTQEVGKQVPLGAKGRLQRQLEEAIAQLKARYGYSPVYRCVDVEPWSVIPEERQILVESDA